MVIYLTGSSVCGSGPGVPKAVAGFAYRQRRRRAFPDLRRKLLPGPQFRHRCRGNIQRGRQRPGSDRDRRLSIGCVSGENNQVFLFVSDSNVLFGPGEPQTADSFTNSTLRARMQASRPTRRTSRWLFLQRFHGRRRYSNGQYGRRGRYRRTQRAGFGEAFTATYSVSPSPTNGRGTMTVTSGTGGNALVYIDSPSKFVGISLNDSESRHPGVRTRSE